MVYSVTYPVKAQRCLYEDHRGMSHSMVETVTRPVYNGKAVSGVFTLK